jgi:16S rRNA U1498 N3-methylase RsmE
MASAHAFVRCPHLFSATARPALPACRPPHNFVEASAYSRGKASRLQGVYVPDLRLVAGQSIEIPFAEQRHLRARRARGGDSLLLFDGCGHEADATLSMNGLSADVVLVRTGGLGQRECQQNDGSAKESEVDKCSMLAITVCCPPPKSSSRADWAVEKLTELGVEELLWMQTARGGGAPSDGKMERWRRASRACREGFPPCEQSGTLVM